MKRIGLVLALVVCCSQLVGCTYYCSICGQQKVGLRKETVCQSCRDKISTVTDGLKSFFK